jgi:hypothetical protein
MHIFFSWGSPNNTVTSGPMIVKQRANLVLAENWLDYSKHNHRQCTDIAKRVPCGLKVIDGISESNPIITYPEGTAYVALSYVWGLPSNHGEQDRANQYPKTIQDAIHVYKKFGYKYLWVDRYCIDQKNEEERHGQACQMDTIYGAAALTIIASHGKNTHAGLAGLGTSRRAQPVAATFSSQCFEANKL